MKNEMLALVLLPPLCVHAQTAVKEMRRMYFQASENKELATKMASLLGDRKLEEGVELYGYRAGSVFLSCRFSRNPYHKLTLFKQGKEMLERAIAYSAQNAELRLLRFSVQINVPSFLHYSNNIGEDKQVLMNYLQSEAVDKDIELRDKIKELLLSSTHCSQEERRRLSNIN